MFLWDGCTREVFAARSRFGCWSPRGSPGSQPPIILAIVFFGLYGRSGGLCVSWAETRSQTVQGADALLPRQEPIAPRDTWRSRTTRQTRSPRAAAKGISRALTRGWVRPATHAMR